MILLSGFLDVLFRGLVFIGLALGVGGTVFYWAVLRPLRCDVDEAVLRRTAAMISIGAFVVAASQLLTVATAAATLYSQSNQWSLLALSGTDFARAATVHSALALCLAVVGLSLRARPQSGYLWLAAAICGASVMAGGAWLTHGASRLHNSTALMSLTVVHQLAAVVWIGGTVQLTAMWRLLDRSSEGKRVWPRVVGRFSPLAIVSVVVLVSAGYYLATQYVGGARGLVGTAYGTMLLTKIALMSVLLLLGAVNNLTVRNWRLTGQKTELLRRTPALVEIEAGIGIIVLMAAAALTGQPPAIDVLSQSATPREVLEVFAPKVPRLVPPPHAEMLATATSSTDVYALPSPISEEQSDFNHNVSGICVILVGLGAFLNRLTRWRWTRHWPLLFLPLAAFLLVIGEPNGWPLGPEPFWKTMIAPEVLQHRLATLLVLVLALVEWRVETGGLAATRWRYVFPLLLGAGGALLLTHSHSVLALKWAFLIEVSHNAIAIFAVLAGAAAWLELRISGRESRAASILWPICLTLVGVVLLFYRE